MQPNVTASFITSGLNFSVSGYDLTASAGVTLTLNGYGSGSAAGTTFTTSGGASIYSSITSGTDTIDAPVLFAANNNSSNSTIYQAGVGGSLVINGKISGSTTPLTINVIGGASVTLNGANTISTGVTFATISGTGANLIVGNDTALGTGTFTLSSNGDVLSAGSGARKLANNIALNSSPTIGGSNDLTLNGSVSLNNVNHTLNVNNSGVTTLGGNVYLSTSGTTAFNLTVAGSGATKISGTISDSSGSATGGKVIYNSSTGGTLTLSNANTYTGGTTLTAGTLLVTGGVAGTSSGTGTGAVTVNGGVLGGTGAISGAVSVAAGATISAGAGTPTSVTKLTTGALTLAANVTFNSIIAGDTAYGTLSASGTTDIGQDNFTITVPLGTTLTSGETLTLISSSITNQFSNTTVTAGGYTFTADYTKNPGLFDVDVTAVPEPATCLAGALMVGAAGWSQRRRLRASFSRAARGLQARPAA